MWSRDCSGWRLTSSVEKKALNRMRIGSKGKRKEKCRQKYDATFETCYIQVSVVSFSIQYFAPYHSTIKNLCRQVDGKKNLCLCLCSFWSFVPGACHFLLVKVSSAKLSHGFFSLVPPPTLGKNVSYQLPHVYLCYPLLGESIPYQLLLSLYALDPHHYHFNLHFFLCCTRKKAFLIIFELGKCL